MFVDDLQYGTTSASSEYFLTLLGVTPGDTDINSGIFIGIYHESIGVAGLHYIAFGIGLYGGVQIANAIQDNLYRRLSPDCGKDDCPEFRIPLMLPPTLYIRKRPSILDVTGTFHFQDGLCKMEYAGLLQTSYFLSLGEKPRQSRAAAT
ncbi:hypothetical protein EDD18DRAFT_1332032 [Armillaria luteobubalina]|uniref:Uncharacterized protein n=1 Tax=Armillaria luteobubalina TaxID=153913 RepID=A0AA39Q7K6_9AGAR|nr:hypothetical protein EDD18DRAFT_1332032 [Armillaria luteobubalina]